MLSFRLLFELPQFFDQLLSLVIASINSKHFSQGLTLRHITLDVHNGEYKRNDPLP